MKALRKILLFVVVVVLLCLAALLVLISSASLQTALAKHFLPENVSIARVQLGLNGLSVDGLRVAEEGRVMAVDSVVAEFPLLQTLFKRPLHINNLALAGVQIDLASYQVQPSAPGDAQKTAAETAEQAVPGAPKAEEFELPWDELASFDGLFREDRPWPPIAIDSLAVDGNVIFSGAGRRLKFTAQGRNLRADATPELALEGDYSDSTEAAGLTRALFTGDLLLSVSPQGMINGIRIDMLFDTEHSGDGGEQLSLAALVDVSQSETAAGENYRLLLTMDPRAAEPLQIASLQAAYAYDAKSISGEWELAIDTRSLASLLDPILLGACANLQGQGSFSLDPQSKSASARGKANLEADSLNLFRPELKDLKSGQMAAEFEVALAENMIEIEKLQLELAAPADKELIGLRALQPFGFDPANLKPVYGDPTQPLLLLTVNGLPIDLINSVSPSIQMGLSSVAAEIVLSGTEENFKMMTKRPLQIKGLSLAESDRALVDDIDLSIECEFDFDGRAANFDIGSLSVIQGGGNILNMSAVGKADNIDSEMKFELAGDWSMDLAAILRQPFAAQFRNLSQGRLAGSLTAAGDAARIESSLDLLFTDMIVAADNSRIDRFSFKPKLVIVGDSELSIVGPIKIADAKQASDVKLDIQLSLEEDLMRARIAGQGDKVCIAHFETLAQAFQNPEYSAPSVAAEKVSGSDIAPDGERTAPVAAGEDALLNEPEAVPLWAGLAGNCELAFGEIVLPDGNSLRAIALQADLDDAAARVEKFEAVYEASPVRAKGTLQFRKDFPARPYLLNADLSLHEFNAGEFLRGLEPDSDPVVEGLVSIEGKVRSEAVAIELLPEFITGSFSLLARDGIFRALRRGAVSGALETASLLGQLAGRLTQEGEVEAVSKLVSYFNAIKFDTFALEVDRNPDFTMNVNRLALRSQELRLDGSGTVDHIAGRELYQQPIALRLDLGARPPLADLFDELKLLGSETDAEQYRPFKRTILLKGSLIKPDSNALWKAIIEASAGNLLDRVKDKDGSDIESTLKDIRDTIFPRRQ